MKDRFLFALILLGGGLAATFQDLLTGTLIIGAGVICLLLPAGGGGGDE